MNDEIFLNKYEHKKYTETEEERAIINILEDLNLRFKEIETSNEFLRQNRKAIVNIVDDSLMLNNKLREESSKIQAILTGMSDSLYVVDKNEKIMIFNTTAEKTFGWTKDEVLGEKDSEIFKNIRLANAKEPDKCGLPCMVHSAWKNGKSINLSFVVLLKKNGEEIIVSISAAPIFDEKGNVVLGIITLHNMTHEFEIDRAKTEFVSVASHQLRTPLAAIKWFLELLLDGEAGKITKEQTDFLTQINESTERMIDLVNALLNVSRIESGRITIESKPTNLVELAQKATAEIKTIIAKRKQKFNFIAPKDLLPDIKIDPKLIFEVITNLLSNASKYTPDEGSISLEVSRLDKDVLFKIEDNGFGIPPGQQNRIFQKFFRGENIIKKSTEGTGLGLYIVKAIIESSGGRIWFESKENEGTKFFFTLPLAGSPQQKGERSIELTKRFI